MIQKAFDRQQLLDAMAELARRLRTADIEARICVIGGAALSMAYYDRPYATEDVDATIQPAAEVIAVAEQMAEERVWPSDWLNEKAARQFLPMGGPRNWQPLIDDGDVHILVAPADMLLALKLNAGRPGKDFGDIDYLIAECNVASYEEAEQIFEDFYPGEIMKPRARAYLLEKFA